MKKHFLCKLIPPRPTSAHDMTDAEAKLMQQHAAYWKGLMDQGLVILFGPVADPKGVYCISILELEEEEKEARCTAHMETLISC
jgi:uncharacterized protein YciI